MRSVTYSMNVSLDGYVVGPDGDFNWTAPDEEVFRYLDRRDSRGRRPPVGATAVRCCWETTDQDPSLDNSMLRVGPRSGSRSQRWCSPPRCRRCRAMPGLACGGLADEIERLRAEPGAGDIAIGGATSPPRRPSWV